MRRLVATILVSGLVAACSSTPADDADPTPSPGRYTDAEQADILAESIDIVFCGSDPTPDWCADVRRVTVEDGWATVTARRGRHAEDMCFAIASITYDDDAEPIGVHDVMVVNQAGEPFTDCDVPTR